MAFGIIKQTKILYQLIKVNLKLKSKNLKIKIYKLNFAIIIFCFIKKKFRRIVRNAPADTRVR